MQEGYILDEVFTEEDFTEELRHKTELSESNFLRAKNMLLGEQILNYAGWHTPDNIYNVNKCTSERQFNTYCGILRVDD